MFRTITPEFNENLPFSGPKDFLAFLNLQVGRDDLSAEQKSSMPFLRDRIVKHVGGLNFCYWIGDMTYVRKAQEEIRNSDYLIGFDADSGSADDWDMGEAFGYGDGFSNDFGIELTDSSEKQTSGIWISSCVVDYDFTPEPTIFAWGEFHKKDFWGGIQTQADRAERLYHYLQDNEDALCY